MARDRWRWALSSPPPLVPAVIHHLGLFFTYFICNIFRNFYSVNQPPHRHRRRRRRRCEPSPCSSRLIKQRPPGPSSPARSQGYSEPGRARNARDAATVSFRSLPSNSARPRRGVTQACTLYAKESRYGDRRTRAVSPGLGQFDLLARNRPR